MTKKKIENKIENKQKGTKYRNKNRKEFIIDVQIINFYFKDKKIIFSKK